MLDADGEWRYSSLPETPRYNNSDRNYFVYHRDTPGKALRISEPLQSRLTGRPTILLSKRISRLDGSFGGVLFAAIDSDYFSGFYRAFQIGSDGGISLLRNDGIVLIRWPFSDNTKDLSKTDLFLKNLQLSSVGYYKIISPFDGIVKYFGYEETPQYPTVVTVAMSEDWLLSDWWKTLRTDALVAGVLLCMIILLAALLSSQFRFRMKTERALREQRGPLSPAGQQHRRHHHPDRCPQHPSLCFTIRRTGAGIAREGPDRQIMLRPRSSRRQGKRQGRDRTAERPGAVSTVVFRIYRVDGTLAWVEINFKLASEGNDPAQMEFVACLRDVTERKRMEDELNLLNRRLTQLAATDGLTG